MHRLRGQIVFLCAVMLASFLSVQATAKEDEKKLSEIVEFTEIALWYTEEGGALGTKVLDRELIERDAKLALHYTYEIPEGKIDTIEAGIPYYLEVSPHLVLPDLGEGSSLTVETEEGSLEFGKICADGEKAWIIFAAREGGSGTVLSEVGELSDAFFYLQCSRKEEAPESSAPVEGEKNLYVMKFENDKELLFGYKELELIETKAKIVKSGSQNDRDITWKISYTPWQNPAEDAGITPDTPFELRDAIDGSMHSYVGGSIEIAGSPVVEYASRDAIPAEAESYAIVEETEEGAVLSIGGRKFGAGTAPVGKPPEPLEITYKTALREELILPGTAGNSKVANTAELFAEKEGVFQNLGVSGKYELSLLQPVWLEKKGKTTRHTDGTGSTTDWTVTFSPNGFDFTEDNALTLHDKLPEGSTLVEDSVQIDGVGISVDKAKDNEFTVSGIKTAKQPVTITYRTTVPEEMYDSGIDLGENTAWFTFHYQGEDYETPKVKTPVGSGDGSGKPGTAVLVKENNGYHAASRSVVWTVKINPHKANLRGGTFVDDLGETGGSCEMAGHMGGLELAGKGIEDITVLLDDQAIKETDKNLVQLEYTGQTLTVRVGEVGFRTVTLQYRTKVCDPCVFANNTGKETFVNRIATTDMVIGSNSSEPRSSTAESAVDVSATVLTKSAPIYDYAAKTMRWTVEVDEAGLPMKNVVLTDTLPVGLTYVEDTFRTDPTIPNAKLSVVGQELTMELGDIGGKTLIMFETKVDPEQLGFNSDEDVRIENTAVMKGEADGVVFAEVSHKVGQRFVNHGLLKSSKTNLEKEWIEYEVLINPFGLSLPQTPSLVDTLDGRLQLDEDTLRLYGAEVTGTNNDGGEKPQYTKTGEGVPLKISGYDPETNSFTVQLPIKERSKDAYVLSYRADIIDRQAGSYGNSVRFEGGSVRLGGTKQNSAPVSGGGGGGGGVASRRVSITVMQTDSSTGLPLTGVAYTIYQWDEANNRRGLAVARGITDAQGRVSFKVKPGRTYELVETKGISGYDAMPGWEELPEGVTKGGQGFLIMARSAGTECRLDLTGKLSESGGQSKPGSTDGAGDGNQGSTGDANLDSAGIGGNSDSKGKDGISGNVGSSLHTDASGNFEMFGNVSENRQRSATEFPLRGESGNKQGRSVDSPQTGDNAGQSGETALFCAIAMAMCILFLFLIKKRDIS